MLKLKVILWDMDGVLLDSEPIHVLSLQEFGRRHGFEYDEALDRMFTGTTDKHLFTTLKEMFPLEGDVATLSRERLEIFFELLESHHVKPQAGVRELIEEARAAGVRQVVASSSARTVIDRILGKLDLARLMDDVVSGDDVKRSKPDPEIFRLALSRVGATPDEAVVIEDSINGIRAGRGAGVFTLSVPCEKTLHQDHSLANHRVGSLDGVNISTLNGWLSNEPT